VQESPAGTVSLVGLSPFPCSLWDGLYRSAITRKPLAMMAHAVRATPAKVAKESRHVGSPCVVRRPTRGRSAEAACRLPVTFQGAFISPPSARAHNNVSNLAMRETCRNVSVAKEFGTPDLAAGGRDRTDNRLSPSRGCPRDLTIPGAAPCLVVVSTACAATQCRRCF
jgi:hypothetical protein